MSETFDYAGVGLRVGLEVHQQLLTEQKMFCRCPAGLYTTEHDGAVLRHMRPTLSELGEYDGTALMEFKTRKNIVYLLHESNVCTYEMDDTPPFLVNSRAIDIAIEQCLMLDCDIVDEVHIARKQYLDGSIPTGFQRTAIVGVDGKIPFRGREISVIQVSVEEDSCREVSDRGHLIVWRTDRLGMPLIETVTGPDLRTPEEVEEAILLVGRVCRSTRHVRVGPGASRQDVNVSVRGGRRVEIKGVSSAGRARRLVHGEAVRQVALLELRDELHRRGFNKPEDIVVEHRDVTEMFRGSRVEELRESTWRSFLEAQDRRRGLEVGSGAFCVRAVRLPGLAGTLDRPCQPDRTFAWEVAGRIRVIATLDQRPVLLHDGDWPEEASATEALVRLREVLGCGPDDGVVVVRGANEDTLAAVEEIRLRYVDALDGVPHETRQPLPDGSTDFERILPGPDRMYPDTDSPPQQVTRDRVETLRADLPEPPWAREDRYSAAGVRRDTIHYLIRRNGADLVDMVVDELGFDLRRACLFFGEEWKGLRRAGVEVDELPPERWRELFAAFLRQPVLWEVRHRLVAAAAATPETGVEELISEMALGIEPADWSAGLAERIAEVRPRCTSRDEEAHRAFFLGEVLRDLRGRVPVARVVRELAELEL